jgi:hypothetical protein
MTDDQVIAVREKANRAASSRAARIVTGLPDRRARIEETTIDLPGRRSPPPREISGLQPCDETSRTGAEHREER